MMHAMTSLCSILLMSSQFVAILAALNASWSPSVNPVTLVTVDVCGGCQNGGLCNVAVGKCACDKGFGGDHCQFSTKNMKSKPSYHCKTDGGCKNEGICVDTGECLCIRPFHGDQCEFVDDWWNASVDEEKDKRSMIVSASFAVVVMFVVCFLIIYVNIKRVKEARQDAMEIRNATQVDGPPHLRISRRLLQNRHDDIESDDHNSSEENVTPTGRMLSAWYWPFSRSGGGRRISHSREGATMAGLHPVSTAPAILQGGIPPKYDDIVSPNDDYPRGSTVTIQETNLLIIPPSYDEAMEANEPESIRLHSFARGSSTSSGIYMRSIASETDSQEVLQEHGDSLHHMRRCSAAHIRTSPRIPEESDENDSVFEEEGEESSGRRRPNQRSDSSSDDATPEEIVVRQHLIGPRRSRDIVGSLTTRSDEIDEFHRLPQINTHL